jgi:hypothetical protein
LSIRHLSLVAASLFVATAFGCGRAPSATAPAARSAAAIQAARAGAPRAEEAPATKEAFVAAVRAKGVKLTDANLAEIQAERDVVPSGVWAPRPAESLSAQQNLDVHFHKHGHEFKPAIASAAAYMAQGNAAGRGERGTVRYFFDTTSYQKGYQTHVVRWVQKTLDFTAFRTDGAETTYYQSVPKAGRFIEVPNW